MDSKTNFRQQQIECIKESLPEDLIKELQKQDKTPCFVLDKARVIQRYHTLKSAMPSIEPHFAIKACPMPELLAIYKDLGAHLDVASEGELAILKTLKYPPELLIHTHPHKTPHAMKVAYEYGIRTFVLDDLSEMAVLEPYKADIQVLLRLCYSNDEADIDLSFKFGLEPAKAVDTIATLLENKFAVIGCSFHVGSQMHSAEPYIVALTRTAKVYSDVQTTLSHKLTLLDIGGGFPAPYTGDVASIDTFASPINDIIHQHFSDIRVISEPGRFLINPCVTLVSKVVSVTLRKQKPWVFIDDGIYGSFSDMLSGHSEYLLFSTKELQGEPERTPHVVAGPTCDSIDVIATGALLPETQVGDTIIIPNMGAYSHALASEFNSITKTRVIVV